ncbi:glycosyl hydrolase [Delphinella strobiligena]|nr:glycosyl hydrolase [Delphinella strobiligena]
MVLVVVLCAVLATYYEHRHKHEEEVRDAPVKQAIFENFPDPAIFHHNGTWYAYATNNAAGILRQPHNASSYEYGTSNVQIATSVDFMQWHLLDSVHDPLPRLGAWVNPSFTDTTPSIPRANVWAPEILQRPSDGKFVMFYSALVVNVSRAHCVGAAISDDGPAGPFTPLNDTLACPTDVGGAIDPVSFVDIDDSIYLAWKIDGNNHGHGGVCGNMVPPLVDTPIRLMKMQADGITPDGLPVTIMDRVESDGPLIEAPSIIRSDDGIYFLFFSSGCTRNPSYDVKYAWAHSVTGPYTRAEHPLLETGSWDLLAPGSIGIRRSETGQVKMAFHARVNSAAGAVRAMYTAQLALNGTVATIARFDDSN